MPAVGRLWPSDDNDLDKVAFAALFISSVVILYRFVNCVFKSILFINFHIQLAIVFFISHAGPASDNSWRKTQLETEKIERAMEKKRMDKKARFAQEEC